MAKISKNVVDARLRNRIFADLMYGENALEEELNYQKINDRQYGVILTDENGVQRYCRIGVIVAELREDMTAEELMNAEIESYKNTQAKKATQQAKKAEKIAKDKARREAEKEEKENVQ